MAMRSSLLHIQQDWWKWHSLEMWTAIIWIILLTFRTVAVAYLSLKKSSMLMSKPNDLFDELKHCKISERSSMFRLLFNFWSQTTWIWHCSISIVGLRTGSPGGHRTVFAWFSVYPGRPEGTVLEMDLAECWTSRCSFAFPAWPQREPEGMCGTSRSFGHLCQEGAWKKNKRRRHISWMKHFWCSLSQKSDIRMTHKTFDFRNERIEWLKKKSRSSSFYICSAPTPAHLELVSSFPVVQTCPRGLHKHVHSDIVRTDPWHPRTLNSVSIPDKVWIVTESLGPCSCKGCFGLSI